jgi:hypothetical protein
MTRALLQKDGQIVGRKHLATGVALALHYYQFSSTGLRENARIAGEKLAKVCDNSTKRRR